MKHILVLIVLLVVATGAQAEPTYFLGDKAQLRKAYDELVANFDLSRANRDTLIRALKNKYAPWKCRRRNLLKLNFEENDVRNTITQLTRKGEIEHRLRTALRDSLNNAIILNDDCEIHKP